MIFFYHRLFKNFFRYEIPYVETSAVTGQGLENGITLLLGKVIPSLKSQNKMNFSPAR